MDGTVPIKVKGSISLKEIITIFFCSAHSCLCVTDALIVMTAQRHEQKHPLPLILLVSSAASLALLCPAFPRQYYPLSTAEQAHFRDCLWKGAW